MEKWSIVPSPSSSDPDRHLLLVKGDMKDVSLIIKKLGRLCGRPTAGVDGYDFSLYLHGFNSSVRERVSPVLEAMAPAALGQQTAVAAPPLPASVPVTPPPAPVPAAPPPIATPIARTVAAPSRPLWGAQEVFNEKQTFETLSVGAYNRFAHAAAMSVVGAPGQMYQPLFIYGAPGVGKTHMLHAIGAALAKVMPGETLWLTTGSGMARAASCAMTEGKLSELEELAKKAKALLIDDIHLMAVTDQNQGALARLFKVFFDKNLQVVITSVYPPKALGALEEALKISFARGWSVDMKIPNPDVQKDLIQAHIDRLEAGITQDDVKLFQERMVGSYQDFQRYVRRWQTLAKHRQSRGQAAAAYEALGVLFNPGPPADGKETPSEPALDAAQGFTPPPPGPGALNLAVIVPKGRERYAPWLLSRFYEVGGKFLFQETYRNVAVDVYDPEQPFGVPFQIGEACQRCAAQACLILGPGPETKLAARSSEFSHAVGHILDSFGVAAGWIPLTGSTFTQPFLLAHLDFINQPR
jgi:chromosomal replication initiation ATPase DnaA